MIRLNKYALVLVSALVFSASSVMATPYNNDCPYQDRNCQNCDRSGYHNGSHYRHNVGYHNNHKYRYGSRVYHRMQKFFDNPKYAKDAKVIVDISDALYAERQVLNALKKAQDPDTNKVRQQALTVRKLERQYFDHKKAFFNKVRTEDPELLNYNYHNYDNTKDNKALSNN